MKLEDVRSIAKPRGVHPGKLSIIESIKTLQASEGAQSSSAASSFDVAMKGELS